FALVFPSGEQRVPLAWHVLPYVLSLPIFVESATWAVQRARDTVPMVPSHDTIYKLFGPGLLVAALAILALRFRRMQALNARRLPVRAPPGFDRGRAHRHAGPLHPPAPAARPRDPLSPPAARGARPPLLPRAIRRATTAAARRVDGARRLGHDRAVARRARRD